MARRLIPTLLLAGALASAGSMRAVMLPADKRSLVVSPPDEPGFHDDPTAELAPDPYLVKAQPPPKPLPVPKAPSKPQPTPRPPPKPPGSIATPTPKPSPTPPKTRPT
jgi:hypothetical protein